MPKKIMIVDDDPSITRYLDAVFQDNGFETCIANNGKDAVDLYKANEPDLITLDLEMPEEWGPRFFRKVSRIKGFSTPIVVISGLSGRKHAIPKAQAYFPKPFDRDEVLKTVKALLSKEPSAD